MAGSHHPVFCRRLAFQAASAASPASTRVMTMPVGRAGRSKFGMVIHASPLANWKVVCSPDGAAKT